MCPDRKENRSSRALDRDVRIEVENPRTFSRKSTPWRRMAAISLAIGSKTARSSFVNGFLSIRFVRWRAPRRRPSWINGIERKVSVRYPFFLNFRCSGMSSGPETTSGSFRFMTQEVISPGGMIVPGAKASSPLLNPTAARIV